MNENINLCEILKGLEGIELYSPLFGKVILSSIEIEDEDIFIETSTGGINNFNKDGRYYGEFYPESECLLFPSKDQRDWSKFERPIPVDTPMMCLRDLKDSNPWILQKYREKRNGKHYVKHYNIYTKSWIESSFKYIIPYDKFDPNNIEESLKYNIQK